MPPAVTVVQDDITTLDIEAIVNPANARLEMGGGLAGIIREKGGETVQTEARKKAPVPVGEAVVTTAGDLPAWYVIHAPTMEQPAQRVTDDNAGKAMAAVLRCAEEHGIREVAVPGLGTGVGGVTPRDAAEAMVTAIRTWGGELPERVVLVGYEDALYEAFTEAVDG